jgi:hypothetical protein
MKYHLLTKLISTDMEKYHVCHSLDDMKIDIVSINPIISNCLLIQAMAINLYYYYQPINLVYPFLNIIFMNLYTVQRLMS